MEYKVYNAKKRLIIKEIQGQYVVDLKKRLFDFAANCIRLLNYIPYRKEYEVFRYQLSKSATSIGANYEESQASSYAEFRQKIQICLRESRETYYWLRLIKELIQNNEKKYLDLLIHLVKEIEEIQKIFGAISSKIKKN